MDRVPPRCGRTPGLNPTHTQVAAPQKNNTTANNRNQRDKGGKKEPQIRVNDRIRAPKVRVVTAKGDQLGVMATRDALAKAKVKDVTLRLYNGGRHELFNEINRADVISDTLDWLDNYIDKDTEKR